MTAAKDLTHLVGKTPIVEINRLNTGKAKIYAKLEYFNCNYGSFVDGSVENKLAEVLKNVVKLNEKQISVEDFNKLFV